MSLQPNDLPDEDRADQLLKLAMRRVDGLVADIVDHDPTGRWVGSLLDRRLRIGDDIRGVEPLLRDLVPAIRRVGDLLDLLTDLHYERVAGPVRWERWERDPRPLRSPFDTWPAVTDRHSDEDDA